MALDRNDDGHNHDCDDHANDDDDLYDNDDDGDDGDNGDDDDADANDEDDDEDGMISSIRKAACLRRMMQAEDHRISLHAVQTLSHSESVCNLSHATAAFEASDSSGSFVQSPFP